MTTPTIDCEYIGGPADGDVRQTVADPTGQPPAWRALPALGEMHRYVAERGTNGRWLYRYAGLLREPMR